MFRYLFAIATLTAAIGCSAAALPGAEAIDSPALAGSSAEAATTADPLLFPSASEQQAAPGSEAATMTCDARATPTAAGVLIEAIALPGSALSGEYSLEITKEGPEGSSMISQGGAFNAAAGEALALGSAEISLERHARYRVVLVLSDSQGELCRRVLRS